MAHRGEGGILCLEPDREGKKLFWDHMGRTLTVLCREDERDNDDGRASPPLQEEQPAAPGNDCIRHTLHTCLFYNEEVGNVSCIAGRKQTYLILILYYMFDQ